MKKTEISSEEIEVIRNSAPYREFVKAHPDASPEKFIEEQIKDLQGYLFKKKYNRALTPLQHYLSLGSARRQELLAEWGASASAVADNVRTDEAPNSPAEEKNMTDREKTEEKSSAEHPLPAEHNNQKEKEKAPRQEIRRYLKMDPAELLVNAFDYVVDDKGYILAADKPMVLRLWNNEKFRTGWDNFIQKVENAEIALPRSKLYTAAVAYICERLGREQAPKEHLQADRLIDFSTDRLLKDLAENIPELARDKDGNTPENRQRIVDFMRFTESGKKSREAIRNKDWDFLRKEYIRFPKVPTQILFNIYQNQLQKEQNDEHFNYLLEKFTADSDDKERLLVLLKAVYKDDAGHGGDRAEMLRRIILMRFEDIRRGKWKISNDDELKAIEDFIRAEKERNADFAAKLEINQAIANYKKKKAEKPVPEEAEDTAAVIVREGIAAKGDESPQAAKPVSTECTEAAAEAETTGKPEHLSTEEKAETKAVKTASEASDAHESSDDQATAVWQKKTVLSWKKWAQKNDKTVAEYVPEEDPQALGIKIYKDEAAQKAEQAETDILYKNPKEIVVTGKTDVSLFENIVAEAKKNSPEIKFGEIKSPDFKAKLWLACLRDKDIKIIDAPKIKDLQGADPAIVEEIKKIKAERYKHYTETKNKKDKTVPMPQRDGR